LNLSSFIFPWFLVPATLIGIVYYQLALGYLNTGRDLRRMESNARSPIFSGFGELLEGIVTVRAFSAEQHFLDGLHSKIDLMTKACGVYPCKLRFTDFDIDVVLFLDDKPVSLALLLCPNVC
jgi:ABC-type multidrug transport system fused ATPase/permease subunit